MSDDDQIVEVTDSEIDSEHHAYLENLKKRQALSQIIVDCSAM